jgi:hypothetical protein
MRSPIANSKRSLMREGTANATTGRRPFRRARPHCVGTRSFRPSWTRQAVRGQPRGKPARFPRAKRIGP